MAGEIKEAVDIVWEMVPMGRAADKLTCATVAEEMCRQGRATEAAARLLSEAQSKRPRVENGAAADDSGDKGFSSAVSDTYQKPPSQHVPSPAGVPSQAQYQSYGGYMGSGRKIEIPNGRECHMEAINPL